MDARKCKFTVKPLFWVYTDVFIAFGTKLRGGFTINVNLNYLVILVFFHDFGNT